MAKAKLNSALKSIQGKLSGWQYSKRGNATIITPRRAKEKYKRTREQRKISAAEKETHIGFRQGNNWSHEAKRDLPELWARYVAVSKQRGWAPFGVSNADFRNPPVVDAIDASAYRGALGQLIRIRAHDDFEVRDVTVTIMSGRTTIETGVAIRQHDDTWDYTTTAVATGKVSISATARDWPNHTHTKSISADLTAPPAIASKRSGLVESIRRATSRRGSYLLKNGDVRVNYFDKYRLSHAPDLLNALAEQLVPFIPPDADMIAGFELGGVPLATHLSRLTGKPLVLLRKEPRDWGTAAPAEGGDVGGRRVVLVTDVITTGRQLAMAAHHLSRSGAMVNTALCILDDQSGAPARLQKQGIALTSLFTHFELIA